MKKILVLASLLVSLSFGMDAAFNFYSSKVLEWVKEGTIKIGKPCEKVQDKVDGCFTIKEYQAKGGADNGIEQIVVYKDKKILSFIRIFTQPYPPKETEMVMCDIANNKAECYRLYGHEFLKSGGKQEEFEGDAQTLIKKYISN